MRLFSARSELSRRLAMVAVVLAAVFAAVSVHALAAAPTAAAATCETCDPLGGSDDPAPGGGGSASGSGTVQLRVLWSEWSFPTPAIYVYYGGLCAATRGGLYVDFVPNILDFGLSGWYRCWGQ